MVFKQQNTTLLHFLHKKFPSIKHGRSQIEARDGEQALEIYDNLREKPDIIVLDFRMPKINGLEVIKQILDRDPQSNILMISGDPCINQLDLTNSHIRFKEKPVKLDEFLSEIKSIAQA